MKRFLSLVGALGFAVAAAAQVHAAGDYVPGEIIVEMREGVTQARSLGFQSRRSRNFRINKTGTRADNFNRRMERFSVITLPVGMTVEQAVATLRRNPDIASVTPNARAHAMVTPNDGQFSSQWHLHNTGQNVPGLGAGTSDADIDAPEAWDIERGASNPVIVAVVDSGMDYTHPDLAANVWNNPNETANGVDDDGNGIIDDLHGANFTRLSGPPTGDPMDDYFHGTHVSGLIGAVTNNGAGVAGVAWNVKLMALKFLDSNGAGDVAHAIEAIQYAVANGATVINNSWGTSANTPALTAAVAAANAAGVVMTGSAGNDPSSATVYYPAAYPEVIAVSASNNRDVVLATNFGPHIDLGAPGSQILSTGLSGGYTRQTGTSMATALVSGTVALLKARKPSLTPAEVSAAIVNNVDHPVGWNTNYGAGRLNARAALLSLGDLTPPTVSMTAPASGATVSGTVQITADAADNIGVTYVAFFIDGVQVSSDIAAPFTHAFNTTLVANGPHALLARAFDAAGNNAQSSLSVTVSNASADTTPPTVSITAPLNGATVSGAIQVTADAADNVGVSHVAFFIDGVQVSSDIAAPFTHVFDTTLVSNAAHPIGARAFDLAGNSTTVAISVTVANAGPPDTTPPVAAITSLSNGAVVTGVTSVDATATDNVSVARVDFFVDGTLALTDVTAPYNFSWDAAAAGPGAHTLRVDAVDSSNNTASSSVAVTVPAPPAQAQPQYNPLFNPARGEKVSIPVEVDHPTHFKATVMDRLGATVVVIADTDVLPGGFVDWNGRNDSGDLVASGAYIVMIETDGGVRTRKVIVRK